MQLKNNDMSKTITYNFPVFTLFLVFMILKLAGTIAWSWWWVTAPLWIPWAIVFGAFAVGILITILLAIFDK